MKTLLITGATGMIGREIVKSCHARNYKVHYLTTSKSKLSEEANYRGFYWDPKNNEIDIACFDGVDVIINLVGASISKRWTDSYKEEILTSRTETAALLADTIKANGIPIKQVVSASAIGIYPSSMTNYYEEDFEGRSESFLGEVVSKWETAVNSFSELGITVAKIRIGLVLSMEGGALPEIVKPVKFGAGAAFGNGDQWQSWIHVYDLAEMFLYAVDNNLEGVYNGVAPNPMSNCEVTKAVAKALHKPLILPNIPKMAMKLVLGEMHMLLFESQRVSATKIEEAGFEFKFHHLEPALLDLFS